MAQVTNTFSTYDAVGNREELSNIISMITPEDTPFQTLIGSTTVESKHPEWQTDTLATPATNAQIEANDWSFSSISPTVRVGNYTQIADKKIIISRTQEVVSKAGRKSEIKRELKKKGAELKKDMEFDLLQNNASVSGNDTTAREFGGFPAWLTTNDSRGGSGSDGGFNSGTGLVDACTIGTQRAFTQTLLNDVLQASYTSGGNPNTIMLSPYCKRVFSTFPGISDLRTDLNGKGQATIHAGADAYVSDFGNLTVVPNRVMATDGTTARYVYCIDPDMAAVGVLDPVEMVEPAKTGDAHKRVLVTEYTLVVRNQAAHGVVADVYGLTAST
jgi:hypothetical protein